MLWAIVGILTRLAADLFAVQIPSVIRNSAVASDD